MVEDLRTIRVSSQSRHGLYITRAKERFATENEVELHGLGDSIVNVVKAADSLCHLGYAEMVSFTTETVTERNRTVKAVITLRKTKDFDRLSKEWEEQRAEPENLLESK